LNNISFQFFSFLFNAFLMIVHSAFVWLIVFILSNNCSSEMSFSVSLIFLRILEFIFFDVNKVWCMCLCLSFDSFFDLSSERLMSESALSFFLSNWYAILKSNSTRNSIHLVCRLFNFFVIIKYFKLLWSINTLINDSIDCNSARHCLKQRIIVNSFLS
jgi:hypothetical protein